MRGTRKVEYLENLEISLKSGNQSRPERESTSAESPQWHDFRLQKNTKNTATQMATLYTQLILLFSQTSGARLTDQCYGGTVGCVDRARACHQVESRHYISSIEEVSWALQSRKPIPSLRTHAWFSTFTAYVPYYC